MKLTAITVCVALATGLSVDLAVCLAASSGVWDLSYRTLLKTNGVDSGEWIQRWLASEKGAWCWNFVQGKPGEHARTPLDPRALDMLVAKLLAWDQAPQLPPEGGPKGEPGGYFAFLSVFKATESRQMLLTLHDFKVPLDPEWKDAKPGRVYDTFGPVIGLYD